MGKALKITTAALDRAENETRRARIAAPGEYRTDPQAQALRAIVSHWVEAAEKLRAPMREAIESKLAEVNGRAGQFTIRSRVALCAIIDRAEEMLTAAGVSKKDAAGAVVLHTPAGPGKSYARKGRHVITTTVEMRRNARGEWSLTDARRAEIWADSPEQFEIELKPETREKIISNALRGFKFTAAE